MVTPYISLPAVQQTHSQKPIVAAKTGPPLPTLVLQRNVDLQQSIAIAITI